MNILFFIEHEFKPNSGGVQIVTEHLLKIFNKEGHHVILVSLLENDDSFNKIHLSKYLEVIYYKISKFDSANKLKNIFMQNQIQVCINQAGYNVRATKIILKAKTCNVKIINCLHINPLNFINNHELFISQFLKSKGLSFINNFLLRAFILKYHKLKQAYELNFIIKHIDAFVMLSKRFKSELYQISPHLKQYEHKIYGINNPFPIPNLKFKDFIKENAILFVGRLNIAQKRTDFLLQIWKQLHHQLPNWKFWVVGYGPEKKNMMDFCKANKLDRVHFFGKCDPNPYYQKAKLFHMTSAFEGFGNVLVEAQSYGCVPIMFDSYSAAEDIVINDKTGYLIKPFNIEDYVNQTIELAKDDNKLENLSLNAREHSKNFSYEKTYEKWNGVFKAL